eukprot:4054156-Lingulodinium_polyedra.AAC.1
MPANGGSQIADVTFAPCVEAASEQRAELAQPPGHRQGCSCALVQCTLDLVRPGRHGRLLDEHGSHPTALHGRFAAAKLAGQETLCSCAPKGPELVDLSALAEEPPLPRAGCEELRPELVVAVAPLRALDPAEGPGHPELRDGSEALGMQVLEPHGPVSSDVLVAQCLFDAEGEPCSSTDDEEVDGAAAGEAGAGRRPGPGEREPPASVGHALPDLLGLGVPVAADGPAS